MTLTSKQRQFLKAKAHNLSPVVHVGDAGLTKGVVDATEQVLAAHELIKVRIQQGDKQVRSAIAQQLCERTEAELVQSIGRMAILYRPASEPTITLPAR
mgnify:CR=1 FL=1